jgi:branched-chain amino acid transport system ATP-binding protein
MNKKDNCVLEVSNMSTGYGSKSVLENVNLCLEEGEMLFIIGQNGSGKSTLLKTISGSLDLQEGDIRINGELVEKLNMYKMVEYGISFFIQGGLIMSELTVAEHLHLSSKGKKNSDSIDEAFYEFPNLKNLRNKLAGNLSGGERQMLSFGMLLLQKTNIWVLDEPTSGLAPKFVDFTIDYLRRKNENGINMLIVEHNMEVAFQLADNIMIAGDSILKGKFGKDIFLGNNFLENYVY